MPLVSVLVTAYNRQDFIADAIRSVLDSSFTDFELIVVDDCSTDDTVKIAREFEAADKRVKVYVNEKNLGDYPNRNKAAGYAKGKYIKYLDSDDMLFDHGLKVMVEAIEKFPGAAMAMMWVYDNSITEPILYSPEMATHEYFINGKWLLVGPSGCIYNASVFFELNGFSGRQYVGDFEYNLKCAIKYPIVKMANNLIFYRIHDQQQGLESGHTKTYRVWEYKIQHETLMNPEFPLGKHEKKKALKRINKLQARRVVFLFLKKFDVKTCYAMINRSGMGWINFFRGIFSV